MFIFCIVIADLVFFHFLRTKCVSTEGVWKKQGVAFFSLSSVFFSSDVILTAPFVLRSTQKSAIFLSAARSALSRRMLGNNTDLTFDTDSYAKQVTCYITGKAELRTVNVAVAEEGEGLNGCLKLLFPAFSHTHILHHPEKNEWKLIWFLLFHKIQINLL